jgi:hypothetical protein
MSVNYVVNDQARIDIFAKGGEEYKIYYDTIVGQPYTGDYLTPTGTPIALGDSSYILVDGFVPRKYYYFNSKATNSYGNSSYSDSVIFCIYQPNYKVTVVTNSPTNVIKLKMLDENLAPNDGSEYQVQIIDAEDNVTNYGGEGYIPTDFVLNNIDELLTLKSGSPVYWRNNAAYILRLTYKLCGIERVEQINFSATVGTYGSSKSDTEYAEPQIEKLEDENIINIYPNPFTTSFRIVFSNPVAENVVLTILDITGKDITTVSIPANTTEHELNFDNAPAGMYIVRATNASGNLHFFNRIVKTE